MSKVKRFNIVIIIERLAVASAC